MPNHPSGARGGVDAGATACANAKRHLPPGERKRRRGGNHGMAERLAMRRTGYAGCAGQAGSGTSPSTYGDMLSSRSRS